MALTLRAARAVMIALAGLAAGGARGQQAAPPAAAPAEAAPMSSRPPAPFSPDPSLTGASEADAPDTWIFSGALQDSHETFSGTLVTSRMETRFELKLAGGATCDGGDLTPNTGLVRLSEITCSDDRAMKALFVPQGGEILKVFGHVGDERFVTIAHLLGTEPPPEKPQTAAPHAPSPIGPGDPRPPVSRPAPG